MKKKRTHSFFFYRVQDIAIALNWIGVRFAWRPKIRYSKDAKKSRIIRKKAIIVCNHTSFADPPCICGTFPFRRIFVVTAKEMFKKPFEKPLEMLGCVKIDRDIVDTACIRHCLDLLQDEKIVAIFPEGKINLDDKLADFKSGAVLLAALSGAQIIPVYNLGNYKRRQRVQIMIGKTTSFEELGGGPVTKERIDELTDKLKEKIDALRTELCSVISPENIAAAEECRLNKIAKLSADHAAVEEANTDGQA